MNQTIIQPSGQTVVVHKGWKRPSTLDAPDTSLLFLPVAGTTSSQPSQGDESSARSFASVSSQQFAFIDNSEPLKGSSPQSRKLVRSRAAADTAARKKQLRQRHLKQPESSDEENNNAPVSCSSCSSHTLQCGVVGLPDPHSVDWYPSLAHAIGNLEEVSNAMFPMQAYFKFNPLSPAPWFDFALSDEALFHAVLYTAALWTDLVEDAKESQRASWQMSRSIQVVNHRLTVPFSDIADGTLGAVSCLALGGAISGNGNSWKVHMAGLKQMVRLKGTFETLPLTLQMKLWRADITGAVDYLSAPYFVFRRSGVPSLHTKLGLSSLPEDGSLAQIASFLVCRPRLVSALEDLMHFSEAIDFCLTQGPVKVDQRAFVEDSYHILYGLMSQPETRDEEDVNSIEEALRVGALIYMKAISQEFPFSVLGSQTLVRRLKKLLSQTNCIGPLTTWLLFLGGIASKDRLDRTWFVAQLAKNVTGTWEEISETVNRILWIKKILELSCKELWEEAEITREIFVCSE